ncbi:MAG: ImmA/IrrE family metallo-endopeptidase [Truepera sp.]|nr:ImmA/IrrE family metallo-endopeptidase [Truepera sp.]
MPRICAKEWRLGVDPISNLTSLLEDRGIKVLVIELPARVSGLACLVRSRRQRRKIPVISARRAALERRRFTLAHELAHRLIDGSSPVDYERAVPVFAGAFLVPREHLVREIGAAGRATGN